MRNSMRCNFHSVTLSYGEAEIAELLSDSRPKS